MLTDWVLIRRLAAELEARLTGARVEDVGLLDDGRIGLLVRSRGRRCVLAADLFASPPLLTIEEAELSIVDEPGFVRALARSLRGMSVAGAGARPSDRLIRMSFGSRSRFGVGDRLDLYFELVPRFGNLVLVKGETVIAALKEFSPAQNSQRAVQAGSPYALPPLPKRPALLAQAGEQAEADALAPMHLYRRDGILVGAYVVPLEAFADAEHEVGGSLLDAFAEVRAAHVRRADDDRTEQRRRAILKRLDERRRKLRAELARLLWKRRGARKRDELRAEGEHIFATLHERTGPEREEAKERAAALFAQYRKLGKSLPHYDQRERAIRGAFEAIETLAWEAGRTGSEDLDDVASAVAELEPPRATGGRMPARRRRRAPLEVRTPSGSRIVVGRSPLENADLTFRIARPNDLWFHAQGTPGAHVILSRSDRSNAPDEDLQTAAALAAYYSKAKNSLAVPVDYTLRKHVRKQRAAAPGLVWYTQAKTILAHPQAAPEG